MQRQIEVGGTTQGRRRGESKVVHAQPARPAMASEGGQLADLWPTWARSANRDFRVLYALKRFLARYPIETRLPRPS